MYELTETQQNEGVTLAWYVSRQSYLDSNVPRRSYIVEKINGILYFSCQEDIKYVESERHIRCVLASAFQSYQFQPHLKRTTNVNIKAIQE